jgi:polar amino acid transport system substrate-binding protein
MIQLAPRLAFLLCSAMLLLGCGRAPGEASTAPAQRDISQGKLSSGADLNGRRVAVLLGSAHETYATKNYPAATILQFQAMADVILAVKTGKADAGILDAVPLRDLVKTDPTLGVVGGDLFSFPVGAAFNKQNHALREKFDQWLTTTRGNGTYEAMRKRWIDEGDTRKETLEAAEPDGEMTIGVAVVGAPFIFVQDNQLTGFDIEIAERFAASQGKKPRFLNMDFGALIAAVASGKVDFVIASIFVTDERKKQVDFGGPYFQMGAQAFALATNIAPASIESTPTATPQTSARIASAPGAAGLKIRSGTELDGLRIAVLQGSATEAFATKNYTRATILRFTSPADTTVALKAGKADVGLGDESSLVEITRDDPSLAVLPEPLFSFPVGVGFNKANRPLNSEFNAFLGKLKADGTLEDIFTRWAKKRDWRMPDIPTRAGNGVLRVGITADAGAPFEFVQDNEIVGIDAEIIKRFAAHSGREVRFMNMEFGALIAAVATNKVDLIISGIFITPERLLRIDFSDPYDHVAAKAYALKTNIATYADMPVRPGAAVSSTDSAGAPPISNIATAAAPGLLRQLAESFHSNIIKEKRYLLIVKGLEVTVIISILSTLFGTLLGALVCFMRMSPKAGLRIPATVYIAIMRGTPVLVLLMLIFYVVFGSSDISPILVAVLAFGMNFAAYVAEIFRTGIQSVDKGQTEAGIAMGFRRISTFMNIVLPQTVQRILPVYKGEFLSLVKMTSIVGYIAVEDLTKASDIIRSRTFDAFFPLIMVALLYFLISWILMQGLEHLERRTDPKRRRRTGAAS